MKVDIFEPIREFINNSNTLPHTNVDNAELFFSDIPEGLSDKVNITIVGPNNYTDTRTITGLITKLLKQLGSKHDFRIIANSGRGLPAIVKNYALRNGLDLDIYEDVCDEHDNWQSSRKRTYRRMVKNSHVVILFGKRKLEQELYEEARNGGRLLVRFMANI